MNLFLGIALAALLAQNTPNAAVTQIDTDCLAIQNAVMALKPMHVALEHGTWSVLSDADYAVVVQQKAIVTYADVWKQGNSYAWVHVHRFNAEGTQRATQLCFRQADGTLQRARQATTADGLMSASAEAAYYASDGTLIQKTELFAVNDPNLAMKIQSLPFFSVLP